MEKESPVEKRRHQRFIAQDGAFAVVKCQVSKVGQILDISMGGLALHYIANGTPSNSSYTLDILLSGNGFYLERIPFETITDIEIPNQFPFTSLIMRRQGVKFLELSPQQALMLEEFIREHTVGRA